MFSLLIIFAIFLSNVSGAMILDECIKTKINTKNNISKEFCGSWNCAYDNSIGTRIKICKLTDGPQDISGCIGGEKQLCGLFNCIIRSPYLHTEDCVQLYDGTNRIYQLSKEVTCPPCPVCPTAMPCTLPDCSCPESTTTCPPVSCPTYPPCPTCPPAVTCKPCPVCPDRNHH